MQRNKSLLAAAVLVALTGAAHAGDVTVSGFLTVGGGVADDEEATAYAGYSEEDFTFDADTVFGLQVSSAVNDKLTVTGQLIARGTNDYEVDAEWAYLSYAVNDSFTWRMGRFRTPLYLYSDYVDVGYAFSWIRAPREVYYLPFNNVQGIDFLSQYSIGSWDGTVQGYYGALTDSFFNTDFQALVSTELRNQMGLAVTLGNDWLTLRAAYHKADFDLTGYEAPLAGLIGALQFFGYQDNAERLLVEEDSGDFISVGFTIDTGTFVAAGESIRFEIDDAPFSIDKRSYLMLGFRAGDFLFHVTGSRSRDDAADLSSGIDPTILIPTDDGPAPLFAVVDAVANANVADNDVFSVGMRWDFTSSAAFKLQVDDYSDNDDDSGNSDQKVVSFAISTVF